MDGIRRKLKSETGASISFALLLFLVCAAVGAVVLAAATSATGRLSGLAEADQRHYSVTSAAELLRDRYDGETVAVVKTTETTAVTEYGYDGQPVGEPEVSEPAEMPEIWYLNGEEIVPDDAASHSILADAAIRWMAEAEKAFPEYPIRLEYAIRAEAGGGEIPSLQARILVWAAEDGTVTMDVSSGESEGSASGTCTLRLIFGADRKDSEDTMTREGTPQPVSGGTGYRVESTSTVTKTTDWNWRFQGMRTLTSGG